LELQRDLFGSRRCPRAPMWWKTWGSFRFRLGALLKGREISAPPWWRPARRETVKGRWVARASIAHWPRSSPILLDLRMERPAAPLREPGFWRREAGLAGGPAGAARRGLWGGRVKPPGTARRRCRGFRWFCIGKPQPSAGPARRRWALAFGAPAGGAKAMRPMVLTRGYGGRLSGPLRVDLARHRAAADVGRTSRSLLAPRRPDLCGTRPASRGAWGGRLRPAAGVIVMG